MDREFFDNAFDKAKSAFETACKKTGDAFNVEKLKFNATTLKTKQNKLYQKLGKAYFDSVINEAEIDAESTSVINDIIDINNQLSKIEKEINYVKANRICPNCNTPVTEDAVYCPACGEQIIFDSKE